MRTSYEDYRRREGQGAALFGFIGLGGVGGCGAEGDDPGVGAADGAVFGLDDAGEVFGGGDEVGIGADAVGAFEHFACVFDAVSEEEEIALGDEAEVVFADDFFEGFFVDLAVDFDLEEGGAVLGAFGGGFFSGASGRGEGGGLGGGRFGDFGAGDLFEAKLFDDVDVAGMSGVEAFGDGENRGAGGGKRADVEEALGIGEGFVGFIQTQKSADANGLASFDGGGFTGRGEDGFEGERFGGFEATGIEEGLEPGTSGGAGVFGGLGGEDFFSAGDTLLIVGFGAREHLGDFFGEGRWIDRFGRGSFEGRDALFDDVFGGVFLGPCGVVARGAQGCDDHGQYTAKTIHHCLQKDLFAFFKARLGIGQGRFGIFKG